jgi:hypothetical protein
MSRRRWRIPDLASTVAGAILLAAARAPLADEAGASFWLPGNFGSFAATPAEPGWSLPLIYYHATADEEAGITFPRGGRITAGVDVDADLAFTFPTYVFSTPVAGGQASFGVGAAAGYMKVSVDATVTGPGGTTLSGEETDARSGISDLYPTAMLKWNQGERSFMAYAMAGVPVGTYDTSRLANFGLNHWSLDVGGGYTYLDERRELSATLGVTYNFENPDTDYQNGWDAHLDWAASWFLSERCHVGIVGYFYDQLTGDSGTGATLGDFESQVSGIGPQAGWFFEVRGKTWYANLKGYYEFDARNRPEGWNAWFTLAIPLSESR